MNQNLEIGPGEIQHLALHLEDFYEGPSLTQCLLAEEGPSTDGIYVPRSSASLPAIKPPVVAGLPVLFPSSDSPQWYSQKGQAVAFHHDIIKSAFYLLSGFQELEESHYDSHGRYRWDRSVQHRLGITGRPLVNEYFDVLLNALEVHCRASGKPFERRGIPSPALFLSHDIDRITKYSIRNVVHCFLHVFRKDFGAQSLQGRIRNFRDHLRGWAFSGEDPYHNLEAMMEQEKALGIRSTWFFLEQRGAHNSKYRFSDPSISAMLKKLQAEGHEVGLHGTLQSSTDPKILAHEMQALKAAGGASPRGIRQHYLKYDRKKSPLIQQEAGLLYDATLGFAEQMGFRNSYAFPFRLYDFEKRRSMKLWQIPLVAMDVTHLEYLGQGPEEFPRALKPLVLEIKKRGGVLSLLWHNCRLDEEAYPGIQRMYQDLLEGLLEEGFEARTGVELIAERHEDR